MSQRRQLNQKVVNELKPAVGQTTQVDFYDGRLKGFGVRISPHGTKTYFLFYRFRGAARRHTIGRAEVFKLAEARSIALSLKASIAQGCDPAGPPSYGKKTFAEALEHYFEIKRLKRGERSLRETVRLLRREAVSKWGHVLCEELKKEDIRLHIAFTAKRAPSTATHLYVELNGFFNWAVREGLVARNPCDRDMKPQDTGSRDRALSDDELRRIWNASLSMGRYGHIIRILIATGQRRGEVTGARRAEIAIGVWTIPAERNKSKRTHRLPLSDFAIELFDAVPLTNDVLFFAADERVSAFSGFSKCKKKLDEISGVRDWRIHDIRRTVATNLGKLDVRDGIIERILNHKVTGINRATLIYNRHRYEEEMRHAMTLWSRELLKSVATKMTEN